MMAGRVLLRVLIDETGRALRTIALGALLFFAAVGVARISSAIVEAHFHRAGSTPAVEMARADLDADD